MSNDGQREALIRLIDGYVESAEWREAGGPGVMPYETHVAYALRVVIDDLRGVLGAEVA